MNRATELKVTAEANGHIVKPPLQGLNGHKIRQSLGGMLMPAVAGIDNRNARKLARDHGSTFFRVTHGNDIRIAGDHTNRVGNTLSLTGGACIGRLESENGAPKI